MPQHTYINRAERDLEPRLAGARDNLCKLVTLTGATKSGKTVLANRVFPRTTGESIWMDGGAVSSEADLWSQILAEVQGYSGIEESEGRESSQHLGGTLEAKAGIPFLAQGKGKVDTGLGKKQIRGTKRSLSLSQRSAALSQLREAQMPLIIDDFHYLDREFQGNLVRALKPLVFEGHPVILIAIPHRRYDVVKVEREMTGRLETIEVPAWSHEELIQISEIGFPLLNMDVSDKVTQRMANEAYGSPHLMQEFCRQLARLCNIEETASKVVKIGEVRNDLFESVAEGTGKVIFEKLAKGPRSRTDRLQRPLAAGGTADIYKVVLLALAKIAPGMERVEYESLRGAIRDTLAGNLPQAHEVSRVLEKMSEIASSDEASTPVLDWDKEDQRLHITDPFFAFFLKWGLRGEN